MSTFKPDQLAERRAELSGDCRDWTPRDALLAALRDLDAGEINPVQLVVSFKEPLDGGEVGYRYYAAGVTTMEHAGLLAMHLARVSAQ